MKKILQTILLSLLSVQLAFALPFDQIIGDDAELYFSIRSLSEIRETLDEHPISDVFEDEVLIEYFEAISSGSDDEDESDLGFFEEMEDVFGLTEDEFFDLFPGQVCMAVCNLSGQILGEGSSPELVIAAEFSAEAERLNELLQIQFERNAKSQKEVNPLVEHEMIEETFMGETLYFDETFNGEETYIEDGYALVDGIFVLATPESRLREVVQAIKEGSDSAISETEPYLESREFAGRGDVSCYVNLVEIMPSVAASLGQLPELGSLALVGITPDSLRDALSLESIQALFMSMDLVEDGLLCDYGFLYSEKAGLLSLLEYVEGELPEARYVPSNVLNTSLTLFDLSAMYANLEEVLDAASPALLPMMDARLQNLQADTGIDLREAVLNNFGTHIVSYSVMEEDILDDSGFPRPQQVFALEVKDTAAFSQAIGALVDSSPRLKSFIEESVFEGETIYTFKTPSAPSSGGTEFSYTITRSRFILAMGHISLLHSLLSKLDKTSDGFWQDSEVDLMFERIERPNVVTRSYYDFEQIIEPFFEFLLNMSASHNFPESLASGEIPDSLKGSYRMFSEGNQTPFGLLGRTLIVKSKE